MHNFVAQVDNALLTGAVGAEARLPLTLPELDQIIGRVRKELLGLVRLSAGSRAEPIYQSGIEIPEEVDRQVLPRLAEVGFLLYQDIFYGNKADAATRLMGDRLRQLASGQTLKLSIFSEEFLLPWGLLYVAKTYDPQDVSPELFLGFKHVIEHIPLQQSMQVLDNRISSHPHLGVGLGLDGAIDTQMGITAVADQIGYWEGLGADGGVRVRMHPSGDALLASLAPGAEVEQILYFYCHAIAYQLSDPAGPDSSALKFGDGKRLTLRDFRLRAPTTQPFAGTPLVFINACESAELSPLFYGGFMPYFTAKGARGMIGTECEVPALFAAEWARRFFDRFLVGNRTLGEVFLELRREFYYRERNVLGLLYAVYCDGDTRVVPGVGLN